MAIIYLTGFMGAGKTTVGQQLAEFLSFEVVDTDQYIENKLGQTIPDIFAKEGEQAFRTYETEALNEITGESLIVTTGGGIIQKKENRDIMKKKGVIIYLHCELEEIFNRLEGDESRPLLKGKNKEQVATLFADRLPHYEDANHVVDTTNQSLEDIVYTIKKKVE
ncbi:shikimate kinase [Desertibacillus haloalkaliphilus]|uniref:shikimate kinase n=1 Tax=Desertibacillus haloalkaliphilus TaxID=1328930 RepID=UPI001C254B48|nr:shikimate kinase [Desertibacillus haloalkaliphilus]MBU8908984.1 shikimate kinase [Desertibacillus haloalkaliphilus]